MKRGSEKAWETVVNELVPVIKNQITLARHIMAQVSKFPQAADRESGQIAYSQSIRIPDYNQ